MSSSENQYDAIAEAYQDSKQLPFRKYIEAHSLFELLGDIRGATVLDLACGDGFYTRKIKQAGALEVTGVDLSAEMIKLAEEEERTRPLGCKYLHRDVAALELMGRSLSLKITFSNQRPIKGPFKKLSLPIFNGSVPICTRLSSIFPHYAANQNAAKLTRAQKEEIARTLHTPDSLPAEWWTLPRLTEYIRAEFGVVYESDRSYHYLLKHLGFSFKLPTPVDVRRDDQAVEHTRAAIRERIKPFMASDTWAVLCADETQVRYEEEITRAWLPKGSKTILKLSRQQEGQHYFGALNLQTGHPHLIPLAWQDTDHIGQALTRIKKKYPNKKICILWDNATWHQSQALREQLGPGKPLEGIHLISLPPYARDKNPQEKVWRYAKEKIRNQHFSSGQQLQKAFRRQLQRTFHYKI